MAEGCLSAVTAVHPSSKNRIFGEPKLIIGSIAKAIPGFNKGPVLFCRNLEFEAIHAWFYQPRVQQNLERFRNLWAG